MAGILLRHTITEGQSFKLGQLFCWLSITLPVVPWLCWRDGMHDGKPTNYEKHLCDCTLECRKTHLDLDIYLFAQQLGILGAIFKKK